MPIETNFNQNDLNIALSEQMSIDVFGSEDYIKLSVHSKNGAIVTIPNSYVSGNLDNYFTVGDKAIFYHVINPAEDVPVDLVVPSRIGNERFLETPRQLDKYVPDASDTSHFIKINELLQDIGLSSGNYTIRIEILNQFKFYNESGGLESFIVKEVSPSRKEIRLKLKNSNIGSTSNLINSVEAEMGGSNYSYKHVLCLPDLNENTSILNYVFDNITDGDNDQSLILRTYKGINPSISRTDILTLEREIVSSQTQDIYYIADESPIVESGDLPSDDFSNYQNSNLEIDSSITYENYNDLSASTNPSILNSLISGSISDYPNLNINYNEFENHTFFGSAVKKLKNFEIKIKRIEEHYNNISMSLSASSGIVDLVEGDNSFAIQERTNLFEKIDKEIDGFTPYERFLYFDAQSESTASAPGIGKNYAKTHAINTNVQSVVGENEPTVYSKKDGFRDVYKINISTGIGASTDKIYPITSPSTHYYRVEQKPFFGYSGSIYLSFLIKGDHRLDGEGSDTHLMINDDDYRLPSAFGGPQGQLPYEVPVKTISGSFIQKPDITGSIWARYVIEQSASYWIPNNTFSSEASDVTDWGDRSTEQIHVLSGSIKTGSYDITAESGYQDLATTITGSGIPFRGSITPAGALFPVHWLRGSVDDLNVYMTDVKITLNNPTNIIPFAQLPLTSSSEWTDWYNGTLDSASAFDSSNIHSIENNLPLYIQESVEYEDAKKFLSMTGEQYDLIRNHIDGYLTLYKRGYKDNNDLTSSIDKGIVPDNILPMLGKSLGWEFISPFTGSLADYYNTNLSGVTDVNTIRNNTWRKSLNNLLYLYKSKGTRNSVNALLNIYGYPSDVLEIQEYGGSTHNRTPGTSKSRDPFEPDSTIALFSNDGENDLKEGLFKLKNITSFVKNKKKLYHYRFVPKTIGRIDRQFELDWNYNNVTPDTLEFVYKHNSTKNTQELFINSGSGNQTLWDLRLLTAGTGASGSFEFRLSTANTGSNTGNDIGNTSLSMSTDYISMSSGQLWNVMLQRFTSSISGTGVQTYQLAAGLQNGDKLSEFLAVSMSVSGGITNTYVTGGAEMSSSVHGLGYFANQNWLSTGSRHVDSSSNLIVGKNISSSIAQIRTWEEPLKITKFKEHIFDKSSIIGNTVSSSTDSLIYNFRLNENYTSGSISSSKKTLDIIDANPKGPKSNPTDYSFTITGSIVTTGSTLYGYDIIDTFTQTPKHDGLQNESNKIYLRPRKRVVGNLSPNKSAVVPIEDGKGVRESIKTSNKLTLDVSPTNTVDKFIIENLSNIDLSQYYGKPSSIYSASYTDLDKFKRDFFNHHNIEVDINKFVRAYEGVFNQSIYGAVDKVVPGRSDFKQPSVVIKPTILERQTIQNHKITIDSGSPNLGNLKDTIDYQSFISLKDTTYEDIKTGSFNLFDNINESGKYVSSSDGDINVDISQSSKINFPTTASINYETTTSISLKFPTSGTFDGTKNISGSGLPVYPTTSSIDLHNLISTTGSKELPISGSDIEYKISQSVKLQSPTTASLNVVPNITSSKLQILQKSGSDISIRYIENLEPTSSVASIITGSKIKLISTEYLNTTGSLEIEITGSTADYYNTRGYRTYKNIHNEWGVGDNDTHFIGSATGSRSGNKNTGHIDDRFTFTLIGDVEVMSGSFVNEAGVHHMDFTNHVYFHNRQIVDKNKKENSIGTTSDYIRYHSYFGNTFSVPPVGEVSGGIVHGRMMGKTRFFTTRSSGEIIYPSNHVTNYANQFSDMQWRGTQNVDPGVFPPQGNEDYSSASFYRVNVTPNDGDNQIIVKTGGRNQIDSDNNIVR